MTVRVRPRAWTVSLALLAAATLAGANDLDRWHDLGLSMSEIELIHRLDLSRSKVEDLMMLGVTIQEYARRPWEQLGIEEEDWVVRMRLGGTGIATLERYYTRSGPVVRDNRPSLLLAFAAPGVPQIREKRTLLGGALAGAALSFAILTFTDRHQEGAIRIEYPILLGLTMTGSWSDVWWRHHRRQVETGFTKAPGVFGPGRALNPKVTTR